MVWWHGDDRNWLAATERRWDDERSAAELRRLVRGGRGVGGLQVAFRWAYLLIEHTSYIVRAYLTSSPSQYVDEEPEMDREIERLLALLAPDGEVLHVERVGRQTSREEERCSSGR